jgi:hypothetical protein
MAYERMGLQGVASSGFVAQLDWASAIPSFRAHWVRFLVEIGRIDDARETFEGIAADEFVGVTKEIGYLNALAHLSVVAVALGDRARAETLYSLLRPYPHHNTPNGFQYCLGSVSFFLGSLARLLGRSREAAGHLEDALAMNQRLGYVPQAARTQVALAELLGESSRLPDRARAGAMLAEAGATAQRLDMAPLAAQVELAVRRLGDAAAGRPPARARG